MTMTAVTQFNDAAKSAAVRDFAAAVGTMQGELAKRTVAERVSQFGFSSIEDEFLMAYDARGQARMRVGVQSDGTFGVVYGKGDPPPKPSAPIVSSRQLGVFIGWDGRFAAGFGRPGDFLRVDVHMSETSGFTPDGTTIVGTLPDGGGILVGADNVTHYVKIVAVSRGKVADTPDAPLVASTPTDQVAVLPLPATQLAAGAVGAQQLAADIAFISRLVTGNPNGARLELEGRDGMQPGLRLYNSLGYNTLELDASTGNILMRGELRTDDVGERIVLAERGSNDIRFYPDYGENYAKLYSRSFTAGDADYGAMLLNGPGFNGRETFLWITHEAAQIYRAYPGGGTGVSAAINVTDGQVQIYAHPSNSERMIEVSDNAPGHNNWITLFWNKDKYLHLDLNSLWIASRYTDVSFWARDSFWYFTHNSNAPVLRNIRVALQYTYTGLDIYAWSDGSYRAIGASQFVVQSARKTKTNIEPIGMDPVATIRAAPVYSFEYAAESVEQLDEAGKVVHRRRKHLGSMAEDMPASLQVPTGLDPTVAGVDIADRVSVVWAAVAQLADRLDRIDPPKKEIR